VRLELARLDAVMVPIVATKVMRGTVRCCVVMVGLLGIGPVHGQTAPAAPKSPLQPKAVSHDPAPSPAPSGAYATEYKFEVSPGVQGIKPSISLSYSSTGDSGLAGVGWSLAGLPVVRRVNFGAGISGTASDTFAVASSWSAGADLDARLVNTGSGRFHQFNSPRMRFYRRQDTPPSTGELPVLDGWEAFDGAGNRMRFGRAVPWQAGLPGSEDPFLANAILAQTVRLSGNSFQKYADVWGLQSFSDRFGNAYSVSYESELRPKEIVWAGDRSLRFEYVASTDQRSPPRTESVLLQRVRHFVGQQLVMEWVLNYEISSATGRSRLRSIQRMGSGGEIGPVTSFEYSQGRTPSVGLRPAVGHVGFVGPAPASSNQTDWRDRHWFSSAVDVDRDGYTDVVRVFQNALDGDPYLAVSATECISTCPSAPAATRDWCKRTCEQVYSSTGLPGSSGCQYRRNYYEVRFGAAVGSFTRSVTGELGDPSSTINCGQRTAGGRVHMLDIRGRGTPDLVQVYAGRGNIRIRSSRWDGQQFVAEPELRHTVAPADSTEYSVWADVAETNQYSTAMGDFNGDGRTDIVYFPTDNHRRDSGNFNDERGAVFLGSSGGLQAATGAFRLVASPGLEFREARSGDVDGDGRDDLILLYASQGSSFEILSCMGQPSGVLGDCRSRGVSSIPGGIYFEQQVDFDLGHPGQELLVADVDNDGRQDVVVAATGYGATRGRAWVVQTRFNESFEPPYQSAVPRTVSEYVGMPNPSNMARYWHMSLRARPDGRAEIFGSYIGSLGLDFVGTGWMSGSTWSGSGTSARALRFRDSAARGDGRTWTDIRHITAADVNGDGADELAEWWVSAGVLYICTWDLGARGLAGLSGLDRRVCLAGRDVDSMYTDTQFWTTTSGLLGRGDGSGGAPPGDTGNLDPERWVATGLNVLIGDFNGDRAMDLLYVDDRVMPTSAGARMFEYSSAPALPPDLLQRTVGELGAEEVVEYSLSSTEPLAAGSAWPTSPCGGTTATRTGGCGVPAAQNRWLLGRLRRFDGIGQWRSWRYAYTNHRQRMGSVAERRDLGFETVTVTDEHLQISTRTRFGQERDIEGRVVDIAVFPEGCPATPARTELVSYDVMQPYGLAVGLPREALEAVREVAEYSMPARSTGTCVAGVLERLVRSTVRERHPSGEPVDQQRCVIVGARQECTTARSAFLSEDTPSGPPEDYLTALLTHRFEMTDDGRLIEASRKTFGPGVRRELLLSEKLLVDDPEGMPCYADASATKPCDELVGFGLARWVVLESFDDAAPGTAYDALGNTTFRIDGLGRRTRYVYGSPSRVAPTETFNALNHREAVDYDARDRPWRLTDANGNVTVREYDGFGRLQRILLPLTGVSASSPSTEFRYLDYGSSRQRTEKVERISASDARTTTTWLDGYGRTYATQTSSSGSARVLTRDDVRFVQFQGETVRIVMDPVHAIQDLVPVSAPSATHYYFDRWGRISRVEQYPAGNGPFRVLQTYTHAPLSSSMTDAGGNTTTTYLDGERRPSWIIEPGTAAESAFERTMTYKYDAAGRLRSITRADDRFYFVHDSLGRKRLHSEPGLGDLSYAYDDVGQQTEILRADGKRLYSAFDVVGRKVLDLDDTGQFTAWDYDCVPSTSGGACTAVPNGRGRMVQSRFSVDGPGAVGTYRVVAYDTLGRVATDEYALPAIAPLRQSFEYDDLGRMTGKYFPDHVVPLQQSIERLTYQARGGPLREIRYTSGSTAQPVTRSVVRLINYAPGDKLLDKVAAGQRTEFRYDEFGRLSTLRSGNGGSSTIPTASVYQSYRYTFGPTDGVTVILDLRNTTLISGVETSESASFTYDPRLRLTSATGAGVGGTQAFAYNPRGDITLKDGLNQATGPCMPRSSQCVTATFPTAIGPMLIWEAQHDVVGDRTRFIDYQSGTEWTYGYDVASRLRRAEQRRTSTQAVEQYVTFDYDHTGARIRKQFTDTAGRTFTTVDLGDYEVRLASTNPGVTSVSHHFDVPRIGRVATLTDSGSLQGQANVAGMAGTGAWVGSLTTALPRGWVFVFANYLGSGSTSTNESGAVISRTSFTPFGSQRFANSRGNNVTPLKFGGYDFDEETGISYAKARYYDARSGRFLTADTETPGNGFSSQGLNRYAYAVNSPTTYVDPTGHVPQILIGAVAGAAVGFVGGVLGQVGAIIDDPNRTWRDFDGMEVGKSTVSGAAIGAIATVAPTVLVAGTAKLGAALGAVSVGRSIADGKFATAAAELAAGAVGGKVAVATAKAVGRIAKAAVDAGRKIANADLKGPPGRRGNAPIGSDNHPVELHHRGQQQDSPLDEMTRTEHRGKGNFSENHSNTGQEPSLIDRKSWKREQKDYWSKEWDSGRFDELQDR
jgi:RHS repeat-associated protein